MIQLFAVLDAAYSQFPKNNNNTYIEIVRYKSISFGFVIEIKSQ